GRAPVARGLELARVLPELGWNIREPEDPVHLRLGFSGDADARLLVEDAVLAHGEPLAPRQLAEPHVVVLRAREVLESGAERVGLDDAQVDPEPLRVAHRRLRVAPSGDLEDRRKRDERLDHACRLGGGHEDVDVFHGLTHPAEGAGDLDPVGAAVGRERLGDARRDLARPGEGRARAAGLPEGDRLENILARLLADARHAEDLARSSERLEPRDGVHAEPVVEQPGGLGTEATDLEEGQEGRREAAARAYARARKTDSFRTSRRRAISSKRRAISRFFTGS